MSSFGREKGEASLRQLPTDREKVSNVGYKSVAPFPKNGVFGNFGRRWSKGMPNRSLRACPNPGKFENRPLRPTNKPSEVRSSPMQYRPWRDTARGRHRCRPCKTLSLPSPSPGRVIDDLFPALGTALTSRLLQPLPGIPRLGSRADFLSRS